MTSTAYSTNKVVRCNPQILRHIARHSPPKPGPRGVKSQHSNDSIIHELGLTEQTYRDFYIFVEQLVTQSGWIGNTFKSPSARDPVIKGMTAQLKQPGMLKQFSGTVDRLRTAAGQQAFLTIVYRICANYRRRKRLVAHRAQTTPPQDASNLHVEGTASTDGTVEKDRSAQSMSVRQPQGGEGWWKDMISVIATDGALKPLCRPCELVVKHGQHGIIDELDYNQFVRILKAEHGYVSGLHRLTWDVGSAQSSIRPSTIDNARQWKAVIARMSNRGQELTFRLLP